MLVEGESDRLAVELLAKKLGHDLKMERVSVMPMNGATCIVHFLDRYGPHGAGHRLLGLCDFGEAAGIARALIRAGIGSGPLEDQGFQVCKADLEDELIRCLGVDAVLDVIADQGELASFELLQRQPSLRARSVEGQLRRFFGGAQREQDPVRASACQRATGRTGASSAGSTGCIFRVVM